MEHCVICVLNFRTIHEYWARYVSPILRYRGSMCLYVIVTSWELVSKSIPRWSSCSAIFRPARGALIACSSSIDRSVSSQFFRAGDRTNKGGSTALQAFPPHLFKNFYGYHNRGDLTDWWACLWPHSWPINPAAFAFLGQGGLYRKGWSFLDFWSMGWFGRNWGGGLFTFIYKFNTIVYK